MTTGDANQSDPLTMPQLAHIGDRWGRHSYVPFREREAVLDLAAVGVIVQQLANADGSLTPELNKIIEIAKQKRKLPCDVY